MYSIDAESIISAHPGYTLLAIYRLGRHEIIDCFPVLAWALDPEFGYCM
jgi:diphthamide biosynthesis methyltransferase